MGCTRQRLVLKNPRFQSQDFFFLSLHFISMKFGGIQDITQFTLRPDCRIHYAFLIDLIMFLGKLNKSDPPKFIDISWFHSFRKIKDIPTLNIKKKWIGIMSQKKLHDI